MSARILVSACLLGERVRWDGRAVPLASPLLDRLAAEGRLVPLCPERLGGLPVPRPPAELQGDRVRTAAGEDLSEAFARGAAAALALARGCGAVAALLKEGSPSCGSAFVHDGSFRGRRVPGEGLATRLLRAAGLPVFHEGELDALAAFLEARR